MGAGRQQLGQQRQAAGHQHRDERLHPLDGDARRRACRASRPASGRRCPRPTGGRRGPGPPRSAGSRGRPGATTWSTAIDGPLIGDGERADVGDLVAEELDPDRVVVGRREDVQNAAAHGDLAALLDHLHAGVGQRDQPVDQFAQVGPSPPPSARPAPARRDPAPSAGSSTGSWPRRPPAHRPDAPPGGPAGAGWPAACRPCRRAAKAVRAAAFPRTGRSSPGRRRSGPRRRPRWSRPPGRSRSPAAPEPRRRAPGWARPGRPPGRAGTPRAPRCGGSACPPPPPRPPAPDRRGPPAAVPRAGPGRWWWSWCRQRSRRLLLAHLPGPRETARVSREPPGLCGHAREPPSQTWPGVVVSTVLAGLVYPPCCY